VWKLLIFGARPYPGIKAKELLGAIYKGVRLQQLETCSRNMYNELLKCQLKHLYYDVYIKSVIGWAVDYIMLIHHSLN